MILCVTGSRHPRPTEQVAAVARHLHHLNRFQLGDKAVLHTGGCTGADALIRDLCRDVWGHSLWVILHPASDTDERWRDPTGADDVLSPKPARERNADVVAALDGSPLLALPARPERDDPRSGTWMTVRMARKAHRAVMLFWPDGTVTSEANTP